MRPLSIAILLTVLSGHAQAGEVLKFECEGAFAADTSHEQLVEEFGIANVLFTRVSGPEGTQPEASVVFPSEPDKRLTIVWQDSEKRQAPNYIFIGEDARWTVQGLQTGMKIQEVDKLNGRPFTIGGFNDVTHGVVDSWQTGKVGAAMGPCTLDVEFGYSHRGMPLTLDDGFEGDGPYASQDPILLALGAKITAITIFYPWLQE